ncbi:Mlp-like protein, partial [Thalictrum thalictroides]
MKSIQGEVLLNISAQKAWEMYRDNEIISKINPDMLAAAEYIEGDGSPGSLRIFRLGP